MKHLIIAIVLTAFSFQSYSAERDENEIINVDEADVEMNSAMRTANESLGQFIQRFKNPKEGDSDFALKVMVSDENGVEHFWVTDLAITDAGFKGFIANEARTVKSVTIGQKVNFSSEIVTDWSYNNNGVKQGAFTLRVLLKRMPKDQADYYSRAVGWM